MKMFKSLRKAELNKCRVELSEQLESLQENDILKKLSSLIPKEQTRLVKELNAVRYASDFLP